MFQRFVLLGTAAMVAACATGPDVRELSQQCSVKYREDSPPGTMVAKPVAELRPSLEMLRNYPQSYACVAISVSERGEVTAAKLLETDKPPLGESLLKLASQAKYTPGTLNGNPVPTRTLISMAIH